MGLLSDYAALTADDQQLATLNGAVASAQTALTAAQAAVAAYNGTISAAVSTVVADLQGAPYSGFALVPDPSDTTTPPTDYLLLTLTTTTPPGLAQQPVSLAS